MKIKIKKLLDNAVVPTYGTDGAACFDLYAAELPTTFGAKSEVWTFDNEKPAIFGTGLAFEIPPAYVMMIFSRSGHGFNNDIRMANCVGIIDSDYRGQVKVKLTSDDPSGFPFKVKLGDRIAQAMIVPYPRISFEFTDELSDTQRGTGGYGSTGA